MRGDLQIQQLFGSLYKGSEKENPQPLVQQFFVFEGLCVSTLEDTFTCLDLVLGLQFNGFAAFYLFIFIFQILLSKVGHLAISCFL